MRPLLNRLYASIFCYVGLLALAQGLTADSVRFDHVQQINVEDGLAHSTVWAVHQDRRGFLWFATGAALNRYDGYEFKAYRHRPRDPDSISGSEVMELHEDGQGNLWLGVRGHGLDRFDPVAERFESFSYLEAGQEEPRNDLIRDLYEDQTGMLWIGSRSGLSRLDTKTGALTRFTHDPADPHSLRPGSVLAMLEDRRGDMWIGTQTGLDQFDPSSGRFVHHVHDPLDLQSGVGALYEDRYGDLWLGTRRGPCKSTEPEWDKADFKCFWPADGGAAPASAFVEHFLEDSVGDLWVGTDQGLMHFYDRDRTRFAVYRHDPDDAQSLSSDEIFDLHEDWSGILWIATRAGVNAFDRQRERFDVLGPKETGGRQVLAITEDARGTVWIGTTDGGLTALDRASGETVRYRSEPENPQSLSEDTVFSLLIDHAGEMWVGTQAGLDRFDHRQQRFIRYGPDSERGGVAFDGGVFCLLETASGDLWIGTLKHGVQRLDPTRQTLSSFRHDGADPGSLSSEDIYNFYEDRSGALWVATYGGLNRWSDDEGSGEGTFEHFLHDPDNPNSLSSDKVTSIYEDPSGVFWIGTSGHGLNRLDRQHDTFRSFGRQEGLADDKVVGLLGDEQGHVWISTSSGLSRLDLETETFRNFDVHDGLHGNVFYIRPTFRSASGELFFGGAGGLTSFFPDHIVDDLEPPPVVLTDFRLFNQAVALRHQEPSSPLARSITHTEALVLDHRQKIFSLEFAALHYVNPRRNRYAYRLEGFDDGWVETEARQRVAQYTNLDPGSYVFQVKASNQDGVWNQVGQSVQIRILPPPWKTWWAYTLYVLATVLCLVLYGRVQRQRLAKEKALSENLREVDRLKDEFLANTSHELRTPLHGVIGLAEALLDRPSGLPAEAATSKLRMIVAGGRHLDRMVADLLDFAQIRRGHLDMDLASVELRSLVDVVFGLSRPGGSDADVSLRNDVPPSLRNVWADEGRLLQILLNLVSNGLKFTARGHVTVGASMEATELRMWVEDSGPGIPAEQLDTIFEPFRQVDASAVRRHGGIGLGLAISRQLAELQGGSLTVQSEVGQGSIFELTLPVSPAPQGQDPAAEGVSLSVVEGVEEHGAHGDPKIESSRYQEGQSSGPARASETDLESAGIPRDGIRTTRTRQRILVVDDEPINRLVLATQLKGDGYEIIEAEDGVVALEILERDLPDLILLDVMMPRMSGFEACRKIRRRYSRRELPVVFITAKMQPDDLITGFEAGANDYLGKPTSQKELQARVAVHLELAGRHQLELGAPDRS